MSQGFTNEYFASGYSYTGTGTIICLQQSPTINQPNLVGTTTNNNAAAGSVGEFVSSVILAASPVVVTNLTSTNITSISLTAGDWDVWGNLNFELTAGVNMVAWISDVSASVPDSAYFSVQNLVGLGTANWAAVAPSRRFSLASTTPIYLTGYQSSSGNSNVNGAIYARRVR